MTIDEFTARYEGVTVDVDGAYGGQCWDLWSRYAQDVAGVPQADTNTTDGWACSVYTTKYEQSAALQAAFDKLPASATPIKGDVAFWNNPGWASLSNHVAIVLADQGDTVLCLSQNPGPPQRMALTKHGIIGYLRPKTNETEEDMTLDGTQLQNIAQRVWSFNPESAPNPQPRVNPYEQLKTCGRSGVAYTVPQTDGGTSTIYWLTPELKRVGFANWDEWTAWCRLQAINTSDYTTITQQQENALLDFINRANPAD